MNELQIFNDKQFGQIRTAMINDEPYFMLADVCRVLEIANPRNTLQRLNKNGVHNIDTIDSMGRTQQANFINESNLYKLAFTSRKKEAEKFTDWVTGEILPTLRKTGTYSMQKANPLEALQQIGQSINKTIEALVEQDKRIKNIEMVTRVQNDRIGDMEKTLRSFKELQELNADNWRTHCIPVLNRIAEAKDFPLLGGFNKYQLARKELYKRVDIAGRCNLEKRLKNRRERAEKRGASKTEIKKIGKLDVINSDKVLINIAIAELNKMAVQYGAVN